MGMCSRRRDLSRRRGVLVRKCVNIGELQPRNRLWACSLELLKWSFHQRWGSGRSGALSGSPRKLICAPPPSLPPSPSKGIELHALIPRE